jgi:hypothetical protein
MGQEEIDLFLHNGESFLTMLAQAQDRLTTWSASFDQRGGQPVYGDDTLLIVTFTNQLNAAMTPEMRAVVAQFRQDV